MKSDRLTTCDNAISEVTVCEQMAICGGNFVFPVKPLVEPGFSIWNDKGNYGVKIDLTGISWRTADGKEGSIPFPA